MNTEILISIVGPSLAIISLAVSWYCFFKFRRQRSFIQAGFEQIEDLENALATNDEILQINKTYMSDQARRIAWLETRIRRPKKVSSNVLNAEVISRDTKPTITEKRHRVLTLASQGLDTESIASTAGILPGEVELIINLNRQAPSYI